MPPTALSVERQILLVLGAFAVALAILSALGLSSQGSGTCLIVVTGESVRVSGCGASKEILEAVSLLKPLELKSVGPLGFREYC